MTALKARDVERFLTAPDPAVICALIYGPEQGLVRERAERLARAVVNDLSDPWRVTDLSDQEAADPARLADEAAAQSFLGGRRVVRMRASGQAAGASVAALLKAAGAGSLNSAALVIVEAGDLKKTSALRKACEASADAVAIPCYAEGPRETVAAIRRQCADENLTLTDEAAELLAGTLGEDRGLLRQEVEKLILYKGPAELRTGPTEISVDDVRACLADAPAEDSFAVSSLALSGDPQALSAALAEAEAAGVSVIALLRLAQGRVFRLLPAARAVAAGQPAGAAVKAMRPPVFFREQDVMTRQLKSWPLPRLERAARTLYDAEKACKVTGAPAQAIAERALLRLAVEARR